MKIACIGNIVYDCTVKSDEFVKEGGKYSFNNAVFATGGPASTAASVLAKYGDQVDFYGRIGKDAPGNIVFQEMLEEGINMKHVYISDEVMTPFGFILVSNNDRTIFSLRSPLDFKDPKIDQVQFETDYDYILTDGKYKKDSIELIMANPNAVSIIDAGRVNSDVLELCQYIDYIVCSEEFANKVTGKKLNNDYQNNVEVFNTLKSLYPQAIGITITVGKNGYICDRDGKVLCCPAYDPQNPSIDTNGAGDIFHGAFTHALANRYGYYDGLQFANITAAISTTRRGGRKSCPDLQEVEDVMHPKVYQKQ
ncbi:MAG: carbohydrate kinase family protein [Bacilli bacterium]|nr:carbohydrate kinase family protein [Bacilli bacterium]